MNKDFRKWFHVGAAVLIAVALGVLIGIVGIRGNKIDDLDEFINHVKLQNEKDFTVLRIEYEAIKKEAEIEIENMPADAVVIKFLSDADFLARGKFLDDLTKSIIRDQLRFFRTMGIHLVTTDNAGVE